jgi:hypothetical protein
MDFWAKELGRLILVYGLPAAIWTIVSVLIVPLFPNETGRGGTVSDNGLIVITPILLGAICLGFYFHFKTRRW